MNIKLFLLLIAFGVSSQLSAQENPAKRTSKDVSEAASKADEVHAKKVQQKQIKAPPAVIASRDTPMTLPVKAKVVQKKKKIR